MAPINIPRAISVLTLGNTVKVVLYCIKLVRPPDNIWRRTPKGSARCTYVPVSGWKQTSSTHSEVGMQKPKRLLNGNGCTRNFSPSVVEAQEPKRTRTQPTRVVVDNPKTNGRWLVPRVCSQSEKPEAETEIFRSCLRRCRTCTVVVIFFSKFNLNSSH